MEFNDAERRLALDQSKMRGGGGGRGGASKLVLSTKAQREMEYRKKQQERLRLERQRQAQVLDYQRHYLAKCDRALKVKPLSSSSAATTTTTTTTSLRLKPTSIHGEGDKIALPPSVLEFLMQQQQQKQNVDGQLLSPWTFRIGIPNPNYQFPASPGLVVLKPPASGDAMDVDSDHEEEEEDDDDEQQHKEEKVYLEELSFKYCSYTHGTVVEFTQEEGYVGLPASIASALLDPSRRRKDDTTTIPIKRTVDPSRSQNNNNNNDENDDNIMTDNKDNVEGEEEKTPGHLAWGAFDLPDVLVEVTMVELPMGKQCVLQPTEAAIRNGFYALKNIKLVLEQSLIRTRATLSVGDVVHTWHRGVKYDLMVTSVSPATFHAITCINTDLEVDFAAPSQPNDMLTAGVKQHSYQPTSATGTAKGRVLSSSSATTALQPHATPTESSSSSSLPLAMEELLPEPPLDQTEGICTIQIQAADGTTGRRRFDVRVATLLDLFQFAATVAKLANVTEFALVTRFPRRVLSLENEDDDSNNNHNNNTTTLAAMNVAPGRELFLVERK